MNNGSSRGVEWYFPRNPAGAVPGGACGLHGLRTNPPRENGGNFDVKQLTTGSSLFLPVFTQGALFSTGDAHFAQGDGEVLGDGRGDVRNGRRALQGAQGTCSCPQVHCACLHP